jgi:hypothetical protein
MAFSSMSWTLRAEETRVFRIARQNERVQEARTPTCPPYRRAKNSVAQLSWGAIAAPHNAAVAWSITRNSSEATSMAIIVVGAGAAGLMTARELGRAGKRVTILRDRWGGRIHLLPAAEFGCSAEGGAEFVYGEAPGLRAAVLSQRISCADPLLRWSASRARHEDHAKTSTSSR